MSRAARIPPLLLAAALAACGGPDPGAGRAPKRAADFELEAISGKTVRLSDFKGKLVLLDFWATYCGPCHESIPYFQRLYKEFGPDDFTVIGVSVDAYKEYVPDFVKETGIDYPIALDPGRKTLGDYGVHNLPTTFLIGKDGVILREWMGFDPMVADEMRALVSQTLQRKSASS